MVAMTTLPLKVLRRTINDMTVLVPSLPFSKLGAQAAFALIA
jgi:hypothetical protein